METTHALSFFIGHAQPHPVLSAGVLSAQARHGLLLISAMHMPISPAAPGCIFLLISYTCSIKLPGDKCLTMCHGSVWLREHIENSGSLHVCLSSFFLRGPLESLPPLMLTHK